MRLCCLEISDELFEALQHFVAYLDLPYTLEKMASDQTYTHDDDLIVLAHNHTPEEIQLAGRMQTFRVDARHVAIPIIFISEPLSDAASGLFRDLEFVWDCPIPFDSAKFFKILDTVATYKREKQDLLKSREEIAEALNAQDYNKGLEILAKVKEGYPSPFHYMILKGQFHLGTGRPDEAEKYLHRALKERPKSFIASAELAKSYLLQGKHDQFRDRLAKTAKVVEIHVKNLIHWGNIYLERGEGNKSLTAFERALEKDAEQEEAKEGLLAASLMAGKLEITQKVLANSPHSFEIARLCNMKGISMANAGKFQSAEKLYKNAIQFLPGDDSVYKLWFNLGLCLKKKGDFKKSLHFFTKAEASAPPGYTKVADQITAVKHQLSLQEKSV